MIYTDYIIQYLSGLVVIGAAINMPAWFSLLLERFRDPSRRRWDKDPYIAIRAGMVLHGPAHATAYFIFAITAFYSGHIPLDPPWIYIVTRVAIVLAEALFIRSAYLFGARRPAYAWLGCAALWTCFCIYWGVFA